MSTFLLRCVLALSLAWAAVAEVARAAEPREGLYTGTITFRDRDQSGRTLATIKRVLGYYDKNIDDGSIQILAERVVDGTVAGKRSAYHLTCDPPAGDGTRVAHLVNLDQSGN